MIVAMDNRRNRNRRKKKNPVAGLREVVPVGGQVLRETLRRREGFGLVAMALFVIIWLLFDLPKHLFSEIANNAAVRRA